MRLLAVRRVPGIPVNRQYLQSGRCRCISRTPSSTPSLSYLGYRHWLVPRIPDLVLRDDDHPTDMCCSFHGSWHPCITATPTVNTTNPDPQTDLPKLAKKGCAWDECLFCGTCVLCFAQGDPPFRPFNCTNTISIKTAPRKRPCTTAHC